MKHIVTSHGLYVAGEAENGRIGVEKYKELGPDVVTMDVTMDEMNGIEALRQIMEHDPEAKVIMVTSMGQEIIVKEALTLGAKGFILKPFDERQIMEAVNKL